MGTRGFFPRGKQPEHEVDQLPISGVEVKNAQELYLHSPVNLCGIVLS
jgi:hypothetical protein